MINSKLLYTTLLLLTTFIGALPQKSVYIVPFLGFEENDLLFNPDTRDDLAKPFIALKEKLAKLGINLILKNHARDIVDKEHLILFDAPPYWFARELLLHDQQNRYLFLWEPPVVRPDNYEPALHQPFNKIYSMIDSLTDNRRYFRFNYPQAILSMDKDLRSFDQKQFCVMIASIKHSPIPQELYSKRLETLRYFERNAPDELDFYGFIFTYTSPLYKGKVVGKVNTLKKYKFCICYENMQLINGYISEKIFDCFVAGCVPIYWGAANITDYIPSSCFIDRRNFSDDESLYAYLKSITEDEYTTYLENIRTFLASDSAYLFSIDYFVDTFARLLVGTYDRTLIFSQEQVERLNRLSPL